MKIRHTIWLVKDQEMPLNAPGGQSCVRVSVTLHSKPDLHSSWHLLPFEYTASSVQFLQKWWFYTEPCEPVQKKGSSSTFTSCEWILLLHFLNPGLKVVNHPRTLCRRGQEPSVNNDGAITRRASLPLNDASCLCSRLCWCWIPDAASRWSMRSDST